MFFVNISWPRPCISNTSKECRNVQTTPSFWCQNYTKFRSCSTIFADGCRDLQESAQKVSKMFPQGPQNCPMRPWKALRKGTCNIRCENSKFSAGSNLGDLQFPRPGPGFWESSYIYIDTWFLKDVSGVLHGFAYIYIYIYIYLRKGKRKLIICSGQCWTWGDAALEIPLRCTKVARKACLLTCMNNQHAVCLGSWRFTAALFLVNTGGWGYLRALLEGCFFRLFVSTTWGQLRILLRSHLC